MKKRNVKRSFSLIEWKKAFTLAEVLITLTIIGVVAAVTVPTLVKRSGDEEIITKLNKAYSTLTQATDAIILDHGSPKIWNTDADKLYETYKSYLKNSKECGANEGCFKQETYKHLGYDEDRTTSNFNSNQNYRKLILSDGMQIMFIYYSKECAKNPPLGGSTNVCAHIFADLNGVKEPNTIGRDAFMFVLKEDGLHPDGCDTDEIDAACKAGKSGYGCTCRILMEGKINY